MNKQNQKNEPDQTEEPFQECNTISCGRVVVFVLTMTAILFLVFS